MPPFLTLAFKDLRLLFRSRSDLFWALGWPLIMSLMFGFIFGGGGGNAAKMEVAFIDDDKSATSKAFVEKLSASDAIEAAVPKEGPPYTLEQARTLVRRARIVCYMHLKPGFGENAFSAFSGANEYLEVGIDPARRAEEGFLQGLVMQATFEVLRTELSDPSKMRELVGKGIADFDKSADGDSTLDPGQRLVVRTFLAGLDTFLGSVQPEVYRQGPLAESPKMKTVAVETKDETRPSNFEITFPSGMLWGVMACMISFAVSIVNEKRQGTWIRLLASPMTRDAILRGKGAACFLSCCLAMAMVLAVGVLGFRVRIANWPLLAAGILAIAGCFTGIMMFLSTVGASTQAVSGAGSAAMIGMAMTGGGMIPLIAMPGWMLTVSNFSPMKWGILAIEGAGWRRFTFAEAAQPLIILAAVGIAFYFLGRYRLAARGDS